MGVKGSERGKIDPKVRSESLKQAVRLSKVLEAMLAEIAQAHPVRQILGHKGSAGVREENLASVRGPANAGRPMDVYPHVSGLRDARLAGVQPHADSYDCLVGPRMAQNALLCRDRRLQRLACGREGGKDRIPLRVDLLAAFFLNRRADQQSALRQDVRIVVPQLLEETRGALDVGEKKGDRSCRQSSQAWPPERDDMGAA